MTGQRFEDMGAGRILKYWPILICIFTAGAWYQSSEAINKVTDNHQLKIEDHEHRITQIEEAVKYLALVVKEDRRKRANE